jgi:hypothetical protein
MDVGRGSKYSSLDRPEQNNTSADIHPVSGTEFEPTIPVFKRSEMLDLNVVFEKRV